MALDGQAWAFEAEGENACESRAEARAIILHPLCARSLEERPRRRRHAAWEALPHDIVLQIASKLERATELAHLAQVNRQCRYEKRMQAQNNIFAIQWSVWSAWRAMHLQQRHADIRMYWFRRDTAP